MRASVVALLLALAVAAVRVEKRDRDRAQVLAANSGAADADADVDVDADADAEAEFYSTATCDACATTMGVLRNMTAAQWASSRADISEYVQRQTLRECAGIEAECAHDRALIFGDGLFERIKKSLTIGCVIRNGTKQKALADAAKAKKHGDKHKEGEEKAGEKSKNKKKAGVTSYVGPCYLPQLCSYVSRCVTETADMRISGILQFTNDKGKRKLSH